MRIQSFATLLFAPLLLAQYSPGSLEASLDALKCHTVLLAPKEKVVDPPRWSPDSKSIGFKLSSGWVRCDLDSLQLKRFKWRDNQDVAAPRTNPLYPPLADDLRKAWTFCSEEESRGVKALGGPRIELMQLDGGAVRLRITQPDGSTQDLWTTATEDCQALCLSPDQKWVAFLCSSHGVAVMKVPFAPAPLPKSIGAPKTQGP